MSDNPQDTPVIQGQPLQLSDAELDRLAEITPADIAAAKARSRQYPQLWRLLNAKERNDGQPEPND